jgi:hypothetical protein
MKRYQELVAYHGTKLGRVELERAETVEVRPGIVAAAASGSGRIVSTGVAEGAVVMATGGFALGTRVDAQGRVGLG